MFDLSNFRITMAISLMVTIAASSLKMVYTTAPVAAREISSKTNSKQLSSHQKSEDTPWWQEIFKPRRGDGSRGDNLCVISPYGRVRYSWSRSPLFVWFDPQAIVQRVELRASDELDPTWVFYPQPTENSNGLQQVVYDGVSLPTNKTFSFEMYGTAEPEGADNPIHTIPLALMLDNQYWELQTELNELEQSLIGADGNKLLRARVEFFANKAYSRTSGAINLTEILGSPSAQGLFLDVIRELFLVENVVEKDTYVEYIHATYCSSEN